MGLGLESIPEISLRDTHSWVLVYFTDMVGMGAASRATLVSRNLSKIIELGNGKDLQGHLAQPCLESRVVVLYRNRMRSC